MKRDSEALKLCTKDFALRVLRLYRSLPLTEEARILGTNFFAPAHRSAQTTGQQTIPG